MLSKDEIRLIQRIRSGQFPHVEARLCPKCTMNLSAPHASNLPCFVKCLIVLHIRMMQPSYRRLSRHPNLCIALVLCMLSRGSV